MGRRAAPLSPEDEKLLSVAIDLEYAELRKRSARETVESVLNQRAIDKRRALVKAVEEMDMELPLAKALWEIKRAIARFDAIKRDLPTRPPHKPSTYPHFTPAALRLMARNVSVTSLARFGVRHLPGLPDEPPADLERTLKASLQQAARRQRGTKPRP